MIRQNKLTSSNNLNVLETVTIYLKEKIIEENNYFAEMYKPLLSLKLNIDPKDNVENSLKFKIYL